MANPIPYTLLSLPRFAKIFGINPVSFLGAQAGTVFPLGRGSCTDAWWKYSWQDSDRVSRTDLSLYIAEAEKSIAELIGYWPAPVWVVDEVHQFERDHRPDVYGDARDNRGYHKGVDLDYGRLIQAGTRAVTLVGQATTAGGTLVYSDPDGDGFSERATITLATSLTDVQEIKVYYAAHNGEPDWEIRPCRSKVIAGGNVVLSFDSWLFIDPELYEEYPQVNTQIEPIDISTTSNYVTAVDVYREYTDSTVASATFYWEPSSELLVDSCSVCGGSGCPECTLTAQNGCLHIRDTTQGIGVPTPAAYDAATGTWSSSSWSVCREPDQVKVQYYAGDQSQRFLKGYDFDPLSDFWAQIIAEITVSRLERPFCSCANLTALQENLREDLAFAQSGVGSHYMTRAIVNCPFGTRRGEVNAWLKIKNFTKRRVHTAII